MATAASLTSASSRTLASLRTQPQARIPRLSSSSLSTASSPPSSLSLGLQPPPQPWPICLQCHHHRRDRSFTTTAAARAGHNKWSKIRHDKGAADRKTAARRAVFAKHITLCSKLYGPDPTLSSQLVDAMALAKRNNMPKASIDAAIARGQGRSSTGAQLETVTLEVMTAPPASVALIVTIETDNRNRALHDLRHLVKTHGGTVTPVTFLFEQRGRTVLKPRGKVKGYAKRHARGKERGEDNEKDNEKNSETNNGKNNGKNNEKGAEKGADPDHAAVDFDKAFMQAVEAGAEDVEQNAHGDIVVWTQPTRTHQTAQRLSGATGMEISEMDIIWTPSSERAVVDDEEAAEALGGLLEEIGDNSDVQAIYGNAERGGISDEAWRVIEKALG